MPKNTQASAGKKKHIKPQDMQKLRERGATALFTPLAKELFLGTVTSRAGWFDVWVSVNGQHQGCGLFVLLYKS